MATTDRIEEKPQCPLCSNEMNTFTLAKLGLSTEEIGALTEYMQTGKMKDILNIASIALRWLGDPEKTNIEIQLKDMTQSIQQIASQLNKGYLCKDLTSVKAELLNEIHGLENNVIRSDQDTIRNLDEIKKGINTISNKIVGTGIGNVIEKAVIKDLKRALVNTTDSFSDERASKQGTDIVVLNKC